MIKKLSPVGDGLGLLFDPALLEALGISADTLLDVTTDGTQLIVRPLVAQPADPANDPALDPELDPAMVSAEALMDAHADTFRKLAL